METFLNSLGNKHTQSMYKRGVELFVEFYGKSIDEILAERKDDFTPRPNEGVIDSKQRADRYEKLLEAFWRWLGENGYDNVNTRYNFCKGLRQLFRYYNMGFTLRVGSPINQTTPKLDDFPLLPEHVKKMFHMARDLRSQLLISIGNDLGWRISDVLSIKRDELPNLNSEPPIVWLRLTEKEHQVSKTCLSKTTVTLLKQYMFTFPAGNNPYLFFSNGGKIDDETVNRRLKDLAEDAKIELGKLSLTWHCFRKLIISQAKNLGLDPDIIQLMVGKAVDKSMMPYLTTIDVRGAFAKLQNVTEISTLTAESEDETTTLKSTIKKFENALAQIENENSTLKFRFEQQQKRSEEQNKKMDEMNKRQETIEKMVNKIYFVSRASGKPDRVKTINELDDEWRIEDEAEAEDYTQQRTEKVLGKPVPLTPQQEAEKKKVLEEYRRQQGQENSE